MEGTGCLQGLATLLVISVLHLTPTPGTRLHGGVAAGVEDLPRLDVEDGGASISRVSTLPTKWHCIMALYYLYMCT